LRFENQYLFEWQRDENYEKAELLWLWYDYHTEMYDRGLWSKCPSPNDDTMVILASPEARKLSNQNATRVRNYMLNIARNYCLSDEVIHSAKMSSYRSKSKMQKRIDDFEELDSQGKFKFIYELL
jgi:hypothetical protein